MIAPYNNGQIVAVLSLILPEDGTRGTVIDRVVFWFTQSSIVQLLGSLWMKTVGSGNAI